MSEREIKWKYPESIVSCEWLRKNLSDKNKSQDKNISQKQTSEQDETPPTSN